MIRPEYDLLRFVRNVLLAIAVGVLLVCSCRMARGAEPDSWSAVRSGNPWDAIREAKCLANGRQWNHTDIEAALQRGLAAAADTSMTGPVADARWRAGVAEAKAAKGRQVDLPDGTHWIASGQYVWRSKAIGSPYRLAYADPHQIDGTWWSFSGGVWLWHDGDKWIELEPSKAADSGQPVRDASGCPDGRCGAVRGKGVF